MLKPGGTIVKYLPELLRRSLFQSRFYLSLKSQNSRLGLLNEQIVKTLYDI